MPVRHQPDTAARGNAGGLVASEEAHSAMERIARLESAFEILEGQLRFLRDAMQAQLRAMETLSEALFAQTRAETLQ